MLRQGRRQSTGSVAPHLYAPPVAVTLYTRIRPKHLHSATWQEIAALEVSEIEATGETYDEALARLEEQRPEGWVMLGVARWR